jgi:hypothetical protein
MTEPPPPEYNNESASEHETESERRRNNIVLLVFFAVIVGIGVWLVNALVDARRIDDCIAQRRPNCMPIEAPPR